MDQSPISFQNKEDEEFFSKLLNQKEVLNSNYKVLFDFRDPLIKRKEFNKKRNELFKQLKSTFGESCSLKLDCCDVSSGFVIDHVIPLSSNILNKNLRDVRPPKGKKVPSQSFGSNNIENLVLSCNSCNNFKKHKFLDEVRMRRILEFRKGC